MRSAIPEYTLQDYWMAAKHLNKKNAGKPSFWWLMLFYTDLLLLLQPSVLWLSIVTFNNDAKLRPKWILREFSIANPTPSRRVTHRETFTWRQNLTLAERVARSGRPGYPPWRITPLSDKCFCWFLAAMRVPVHPDGHRRGVFIQSSLVFG